VTTVGVLGYSMSTIVPEIGSRTPFIYPDVSQDFILKLTNANDRNADAKIALFRRGLIVHIDNEAQKGKWPITYDRLQRFSNDERLQGIRKSNSLALHHKPVCLAKSKGGKVAQLYCALCSKTKGGR